MATRCLGGSLACCLRQQILIGTCCQFCCTKILNHSWNQAGTHYCKESFSFNCRWGYLHDIVIMMELFAPVPIAKKENSPYQEIMSSWVPHTAAWLHLSSVSSLEHNTGQEKKQERVEQEEHAGDICAFISHCNMPPVWAIKTHWFFFFIGANTSALGFPC